MHEFEFIVFFSYPHKVVHICGAALEEISVRENINLSFCTQFLFFKMVKVIHYVFKVKPKFNDIQPTWQTGGDQNWARQI